MEIETPYEYATLWLYRIRFKDRFGHNFFEYAASKDAAEEVIKLFDGGHLTFVDMKFDCERIGLYR